MLMNVIGLDLSLTSTGYAYRDGDDIVTGRFKPKVRGVERLDLLRHGLTKLLRDVDKHDNPITLAVIEGYAMGFAGKKGGRGAPPGRLYDIGEWGGIARLVCYDAGIPMIICPPANLKMFATGNGAADKEWVKRSIMELWGYTIQNDDEADAFILMALGEAHRSQRKRRRYGPNRLRALDGVEYVDVPKLF